MELFETIYKVRVIAAAIAIFVVVLGMLFEGARSAKRDQDNADLLHSIPSGHPGLPLIPGQQAQAGPQPPTGFLPGETPRGTANSSLLPANARPSLIAIPAPSSGPAPSPSTISPGGVASTAPTPASVPMPRSVPNLTSPRAAGNATAANNPPTPPLPPKSEHLAPVETLLGGYTVQPPKECTEFKGSQSWIGLSWLEQRAWSDARGQRTFAVTILGGEHYIGPGRLDMADKFLAAEQVEQAFARLSPDYQVSVDKEFVQEMAGLPWRGLQVSGVKGGRPFTGVVYLAYDRDRLLVVTSVAPGAAFGGDWKSLTEAIRSFNRDQAAETITRPKSSTN